jgi:hypothetical protein
VVAQGQTEVLLVVLLEEQLGVLLLEAELLEAELLEAELLEAELLEEYQYQALFQYQV